MVTKIEGTLHDTQSELYIVNNLQLSQITGTATLPYFSGKTHLFYSFLCVLTFKTGNIFLQPKLNRGYQK